MRVALRLEAPACGLSPSAGQAALLLSALAGTLLFPRAATARISHDLPPVSVTRINPDQPRPNAEREHERLVAGEQLGQQMIDEGQPPLRNAPPPPRLDAPEAPAADWLDLIVYYGILALVAFSALAILYRYLMFRFSLDVPPEIDQPESRPGPRPLAGPRSVSRPPPPAAKPRADPWHPPPAPQPAAQGSAPKPRPLPASNPPAEPGSAPRLRPVASPNPPPESGSAPRARPPAPARPAVEPAAPSLLSQAAKILSGTGEWMTAGGLAEALATDEGTLAPILENLTDSGRVQEAKAQTGETVYRYRR